MIRSQTHYQSIKNFQKKFLKSFATVLLLTNIGCGTDTGKKSQEAKQEESIDENSDVVSAGSFAGQEALQENTSQWVEGLNIVGGEFSDAITQKSVIGIISQSSICSGTIIANNLVVSARHCFEDTNPNRYYLAFGTNLSNASLRRTSKITILPRTVANGISLDDIAIVEFEGGLPIGYEALPVVKPEVNLDNFDTILVAGYGLQDPNNPQAKGVLKQATNQLVGTNRNYKLISTRGLSGNACFGDSGGAVMGVRNNVRTLIGVVSQSPSSNCDGALYSLDLRQYAKFLSDNGLRTPTPNNPLPPPQPQAMEPQPIEPQPIENQPTTVAEPDPIDEPEDSVREENKKEDQETEKPSDPILGKYDPVTACYVKADLFFQYGIVEIFKQRLQRSPMVWKRLFQAYFQKINSCSASKSS